MDGWERLLAEPVPEVLRQPSARAAHRSRRQAEAELEQMRAAYAELHRHHDREMESAAQFISELQETLNTEKAARQQAEDDLRVRTEERDFARAGGLPFDLQTRLAYAAVVTGVRLCDAGCSGRERDPEEGCVTCHIMSPRAGVRAPVARREDAPARRAHQGAAGRAAAAARNPRRAGAPVCLHACCCRPPRFSQHSAAASGRMHDRRCPLMRRASGAARCTAR